ncbi:hypothetical protein E2C01_038387 [Portunus trituberculatus]|uniref:Uncharacterized protein n=1 Tax=Portunus trituberculatus TaxID=210409 RepID=A0A5B7FIE8_PORTR|nr:hypothetical protein [Portunus trituberculatus]
MLIPSVSSGELKRSPGEASPRGLLGNTAGIRGSDGTVKSESSFRSGGSWSSSALSGWSGLGSGPMIKTGCWGGKKGAGPTGCMTRGFGGSAGGSGRTVGSLGTGPTISDI